MNIKIPITKINAFNLVATLSRDTMSAENYRAADESPLVSDWLGTDFLPHQNALDRAGSQADYNLLFFEVHSGKHWNMHGHRRYISSWREKE